MGRSYLGLTGRTLQLERRNSTRRISRPPRWTSTPSERSERQNQRTTIINPLRRERNLPRKERKERNLPRRARKERNLPRRARKERNPPRRARKERNPPRRERKEKNLPRRERREGRERN